MSQRKISDAIKNVTVITNHRGDRKIRFKVVRIGTESARSKTFTDSEGATKTIEEYFFDQYQIKLRYPKLPLALKVLRYYLG